MPEEKKYPTGEERKPCPCGHGECIYREFLLYKVRQRHSELEIVRIKKILRELLKIDINAAEPPQS